jgi:hypothetical protein
VLDRLSLVNKTKQKSMPPALDMETITPQNLEVFLSTQNWDEYWKKVKERVEEKVDGYALARAKSLEQSARRVLM